MKLNVVLARAKKLGLTREQLDLLADWDGILEDLELVGATDEELEVVSHYLEVTGVIKVG